MQIALDGDRPSRKHEYLYPAVWPSAAGVMKSVVIKRSILINGRTTSVSLENEFWDALHEIAEHENVAISALVEKINEGRNNINLSSAIRVFVFNHYRPINGKEAKQNPHSERRSLLARAGECRALAAGLNDAAAREVMLRAAVDYEVLAERLQRVAET
ncbi:MAG: ribbon-helix-helix domain-containing protein [Pseudolabrys sp.]